jgi:hypothetical protein
MKKLFNTLLNRFKSYNKRNQIKEPNDMMEFKTIRSVSTFLDNVEEFRTKFKAPNIIRDFSDRKWAINNKKIYWWDGEAIGDPQYNEDIITYSVHEHITVINIEDYRSGKHFSLICDNSNRKK